jgi:CheY-like chemotaxis protein
VAGTGRDVIRRVATHEPDLLLLDLELPDLDGWQVATILRADPTTADLPIVALSGYGSPEDRARALQLGCDSFITKPCYPDEVFMELGRVLVTRWSAGLQRVRAADVVERASVVRARTAELMAEQAVRLRRTGTSIASLSEALVTMKRAVAELKNE